VRARLAAATAVVAVASLAGCSGPEIPDVDDLTLPSPAVSGLAPPGPAPTRSVPPAVHRWKTDGLACPTVTAEAAREVGLTGAGEVTASTDVATIGNSISCLWSPGGTSESVTLNLDTSTSQAAADMAWQVRTAAMTDPLAGVGEQAFVSVLGDEIRVLVRSGNATLEVVIEARRGDARSLSRLRAAAPAIAGDMLGSLVPA
jgi:hypothetical protein